MPLQHLYSVFVGSVETVVDDVHRKELDDCSPHLVVRVFCIPVVGNPQTEGAVEAVVLKNAFVKVCVARLVRIQVYRVGASASAHHETVKVPLEVVRDEHVPESDFLVPGVCVPVLGSHLDRSSP